MVCVVCHESQFKAPGRRRSRAKGKGDKRPVALQCGHVFHRPCIEGWFRSSGLSDCPMCYKSHTGPLITLFVDCEPGSATDAPASASKARRAVPDYTDEMDEIIDEMSQMVFRTDDAAMAYVSQRQTEFMEERLADATELNRHYKRKIDKLEFESGTQLRKTEEKYQEAADRLEEAELRAEWLQCEVTRLARISAAHKTHIRSLQIHLEDRKDILRELGYEY
ncbi:hypothetical protein IWW55_000162 [Coemansia sp. RSA 2706]|nr:hypothetical protein IWW55_000162 [Coemansia sp. RSA 2706]KAJ2315639.1 hypothetical protein IWW54_000140 [Coemansia sp. RSA 2705]KAJ2330103.1 hypothetical protein IWW51_000162 [Coemansia sp. RSA 2702]